MNVTNFFKMAHGDLAGLRSLAFEFFNETRCQMSGWKALLEAGDFSQLRDDLHRCKGGASLFGLERLIVVIGSCESPTVLESRGFDLDCFENELKAAENAVLRMTV